MLNSTDVIKVVKKGHLASVQQHPDKWELSLDYLELLI